MFGALPKMPKLSTDSTAVTTNLRVFVRVRPLSALEIQEKSGAAVKTAKTTINCKGRSFGPFNKVYDEDSTQEQVYEELVSKQVKKVIAGFNCTVFAYGQTGTGKTFTMEGGNRGENISSWRDDPSTGIAPRAVEDIFEQLDSMGCEEYSLRVSYVELYNEELYDLLSPGSIGDDRARLRIYDDPSKKGVLVSGVEEVPVRNRADVYKLLSLGAERRKTAATMMNMHSSRSHSLFMVSVVLRETNEKGEELVKQGKLNLVDLAGSENIGRSGADGKRAKEAGSINQSLLTLGRVIRALTTNAAHIPYRESKLTRLLQDSLGGSTITSLIATLSPAASNIEESISTLEYAMRAANIKNKPVCNSTVTKKTILKEFTEEIDKLRRDLRAAREKNGIHISEESHEELVKNTEKMHELEEKLDDTVDRLRRFAEDQMYMDEQYRLLYERSQKLEDRLGARIREIAEREKELDETRKRLQQYSSALDTMHIAAMNTFCQLKQMRDSADDMRDDLHQFWKKVDQLDATAQTNRHTYDVVVKTASDKLAAVSKHSSALLELVQREQATVNASSDSFAIELEEKFAALSTNIAKMVAQVCVETSEQNQQQSEYVKGVKTADAKATEALESSLRILRELVQKFSTDATDVMKGLAQRLTSVQNEMNRFRDEMKPLVDARVSAAQQDFNERNQEAEKFISIQLNKLEELESLVNSIRGASTTFAGLQKEKALSSMEREMNAVETLRNVLTSHDDACEETVFGAEEVVENASKTWESIQNEAGDVTTRVALNCKDNIDNLEKMALDDQMATRQRMSELAESINVVGNQSSLVLDECTERTRGQRMQLETAMGRMMTFTDSADKSVKAEAADVGQELNAATWKDVDVHEDVPARQTAAVLAHDELTTVPDPLDMIDELKHAPRRVSSYAPRESLLNVSNILSPRAIQKRREFSSIDEEDQFEWTENEN